MKTAVRNIRFPKTVAESVAQADGVQIGGYYLACDVYDRQRREGREVQVLSISDGWVHCRLADTDDANGEKAYRARSLTPSTLEAFNKAANEFWAKMTRRRAIEFVSQFGGRQGLISHRKGVIRRAVEYLERLANEKDILSDILNYGSGQYDWNMVREKVRS